MFSLEIYVKHEKEEDYWDLRFFDPFRFLLLGKVIISAKFLWDHYWSTVQLNIQTCYQNCGGGHHYQLHPSSIINFHTQNFPSAFPGPSANLNLHIIAFRFNSLIQRVFSISKCCERFLLRNCSKSWFCLQSWTIRLLSSINHPSLLRLISHFKPAVYNNRILNTRESKERKVSPRRQMTSVSSIYWN